MNFSSSNPAPGKRAWDHFAETDPYAYILTGLKNSNPQEFWQSGFRTVHEELLPLLRERGVSLRTGLELGCGLGRLVFPLAAHFQDVVGVDIAVGMVRRARRFALDNGVSNAHFLVISGPEDMLWQSGDYAGKIDFLYSLLVFQHIPDFSMIEGYLRVIGILLQENGVAFLQFDTRPKTFAYHIKSNLPDFLLPRFWRKGIRRIRRSPDEIEKGFRDVGLQVVTELTPSTELHRYILRKAARPSSQS